jgi:hypothetical protein
VDLAKTISETPLPTIFVVGGILFLLLAMAGSVAGKITIEPGMRLTAGLVGTVLIVLGLLLFFVHNPTGPTATTSPTPTPPPPTPTTASPVPAPSPPAPPTPTRPSHAQPSPGVNCTGTPDEVVICSNARLIDLDWQLYDLYHATLNALDKAQQTKLMHEEGVWVSQRGSCKSDANCLVQAYKLRIDQLKSVR